MICQTQTHTAALRLNCSCAGSSFVCEWYPGLSRAHHTGRGLGLLSTATLILAGAKIS